MSFRGFERTLCLVPFYPSNADALAAAAAAGQDGPRLSSFLSNPPANPK